MRSIRWALLSLMALTFVGCSGVSVDSVYDVRYDFANLDTYIWERKGPEQGADLPYDLLDRWIKGAIDDQFAAKGFTKRTSGSADFKVVYYIGVDEVTQINTSYYGVGWGGYWGYGWGPYMGGGTAINTYRYDEATLTVDVLDPDPDVGLIWRGVAKGTVHKNKRPEQYEQGIAEAVAKLLQRFPPPPREAN